MLAESLMVEILEVSAHHLSEKDSLPKYVSRFDRSGAVDFYVCEICKGRVSPSNWDYHVQTVHSEVSKKKL